MSQGLLLYQFFVGVQTNKTTIIALIHFKTGISIETFLIKVLISCEIHGFFISRLVFTCVFMGQQVFNSRTMISSSLSRDLLTSIGSIISQYWYLVRLLNSFCKLFSFRILNPSFVNSKSPSCHHDRNKLVKGRRVRSGYLVIFRCDSLREAP